MKKKYEIDDLDLGYSTTKKILSKLNHHEQKKYKDISRKFYFFLIGLFVYAFLIFFLSAIFFNKKL
jgi:hypothetical protein